MPKANNQFPDEARESDALLGVQKHVAPNNNCDVPAVWVGFYNYIFCFPTLVFK